MFSFVQMITNGNEPNAWVWLAEPLVRHYNVLELPIKKTLYHPKADPEKRQHFEARISEHTIAGKPIIYVDESGFAQSMPRPYGYAARGQRCTGSHDWHARGRLNVIGAILAFTLITATLFEGHINTDSFYAWLTQDLLPKVPPGSVIVMDNASFHKRSDIARAIQQAGCTLEYLPPYSPDLNPIEHKWAQAKALRRQYRCDVHTLFKKHLNYDKL